MSNERYYPPKKKYDSDISLASWFVKIMLDDKKRRNGKEKEAGLRVQAALLSDKLADDNFCKNILPKLVDNHAALVEENIRKTQKEMAELEAYELWYYTPWQWGYCI